MLSGVCADSARQQLADGVSLLDLGRHRLKDLAEPESVYQLLAPDLPREFPVLRSLDHLRNNVPQQLTSFVGRTAELAEIKALLQTHRLVTLVGTGGVGKTRLALHVGADLIDEVDDGVWFVQLAPISEASLVTNAIASVLGLIESLNRPMIETLLTYLKHKRLLLILDNCEHLIGEVAKIADTILQNCAHITILATSREALSISGEYRYGMPALPTPAIARPLSAKDAIEYGAIALFVTRARDANERFVLTDDNAPVVAEICERLDGIALAIELAAARVKMLPVGEVAQRLDERFRLLTGGSRAALPRQQTLRALIDWSYDLLNDRERRFFCRLSVFAGDFPLEMASAVCDGATFDELAVLDLLSSLAEKSLIVDVPSSDGQRYRLLESMRAYALEKLVQRGELEETRSAHAGAYAKLAERHADLWYSMPDRDWDKMTAPEFNNARAALEWTLRGGGDRLVGQRLAAGLRQLYRRLAPTEGRRWIEAALESCTPETPQGVAGRLEVANAMLAGQLDQWDAFVAASERALNLLRDAGDPRGLGEAQMLAGASRARARKVNEGEALVEAALSSFRSQKNRRLTALAVGWLGNIRAWDGDAAAARRLIAEEAEIDREIGAERFAAVGLLNLAALEYDAGGAERALERANEALTTLKDLNYPIIVAQALDEVATYEIALGRWSDAQWHARQALGQAREYDTEAGVAGALATLAAIATLSPDGDATGATERVRNAARIAGYAEARLNAMAASVHLERYTMHRRLVAALQAAIPQDELVALIAEGAGWDESRAVAEALAM